MIEFLTGAAVGGVLTLALCQFTKRSRSLPTDLQELKMSVSQAFQDLATNIEAIPAKAVAAMQPQLDAANATIAQLQQDATDNLAAVTDAVSKANGGA